MREQETDLLPRESRTLKDFLVVDVVAMNTTDSQPPKKKLKELLEEKKAARVNAAKVKSKYIIQVKKAILGSAAEVERLWSMAGRVLTKDRSAMSPLLFECIMYLKYNRELWSLADVVEANKRRKNSLKAVKARAAKAKVDVARAEIEAWEGSLMLDDLHFY